MRMYEMKFDQCAVRECICLWTFPTKTKRQQQEKQIIKTRIVRRFSHISFIWGVLSHEIQCHRQNEGGDEKENF
jgi:hypothetical protein